MKKWSSGALGNHQTSLIHRNSSILYQATSSSFTNLNYFLIKNKRHFSSFNAQKKKNEKPAFIYQDTPARIAIHPVPSAFNIEKGTMKRMDPKILEFNPLIRTQFHVFVIDENGDYRFESVKIEDATSRFSGAQLRDLRNITDLKRQVENDQ